ncbi:MAG: dehydrogenase E1 component subunit alpha/beta [Rhodothermia bacterium]|nr:dehydrogenase E1 component subunit alpha/beta [Rhodothermia bacterium]
MSIDSSTTAHLDLAAAYAAILKPRVIEEKMLRLIRQGRISKWFSGYGQEAIAVGVALALEDRDYILPTHRNLGVWTTRDVELRPLFCQLMGRDGGFTKGRDRTFHFGLPERRIIGMISHVAAMLPVACGLGVASKYRDQGFVAAAFVGDGASREGDFHEALNLAACWSLPVIFVLENNGYGLSTPTSDVVATPDLAEAARGYGMEGQAVDGNDLIAVASAVADAARRARDESRPTLLEMKTFRVRGHEEASGTRYVPDELIEEWSARDPVARLEGQVVASGALSSDEMASMRSRLEEEVSEAVEYALNQPMVVSTPAAERADVFAPSSGAVHEPASNNVELRFIDAVTEGLAEMMERDDAVVLLGQDVAEYGGVFKVTAGFVERFGENRVRNTPIIESGAVGAAMGMALAGLKPVLEIQYADFISCGFNQIVNNLATTHYRWGAPLNVTIRAPYGGNIAAGPFHSQCVEAWFTSVPGLKVVIPSSPDDMKGLLIAAINDPNPVLVFEHKHLYRLLRGPVPAGYYTTPIGSARTLRSGADATIVTYGLGVRWALEVADQLSQENYEIEVIDLRTLAPWDRDTVTTSVKKTGRLLVLQEAPLVGGFGGEIASSVAEAVFEFLDAPPMRVGAEGTPIPFSSTLEQDVYSARVKLEESIRTLLSY